MQSANDEPTGSSPEQILEAEMDDLIMRMKDCISHEDNHDQTWTDRCITKVQFKQQMKTVANHRIATTLQELRTGVESEYQKLRTIGRVGDDGYTKIYIPAEYRQTVFGLIDSLLNKVGGSTSDKA